MPIEIREITISAQIHPDSKRGKRRVKKEKMDEEMIQEIVDRVLEVMERKASR